MPASTWPRLGGAVEASSCHPGSVPGGNDALGAISAPRRNRSGVLKVKIIIVPPWDSPATRRSPVGLGGVIGIIISLLLFSGLSFRVGYILVTLLFCSILFIAISAASAPVNDRVNILL